MKYTINLAPTRYPWGGPPPRNGRLVYEYEIWNSKKERVSQSREFHELSKDDARAEAVTFVTSQRDYESYEIMEHSN